MEQKLLEYINRRGEKASQPGNLTSIKFHFRPLSVAYETDKSWLHSTVNFIMVPHATLAYEYYDYLIY